MIRFNRSRVLVLLVAALGLFPRSAGAQSTPAFTPGNIIVSLGAALAGDNPPPSPDQVREFSASGGLVQSLLVTPPAGQAEVPRDAVVGINGALYVFNGTFSPILSIYNPPGGLWNAMTCSNWSTTDNVSYGGVAVYGNYVFVTSTTNDPNGPGNAIIRFNLTDGTTTRIEEEEGYIFLCLGWDGLLYAIEYNGGGSITPIDVYNPETMNWVRSFSVPDDPVFNTELRSIAVDKNGMIFVVGLAGVIYEYNSILTEVNKASIGATYPINLALSSNGQIAVADENGYVYLTDETLSSFSKFQAYTAQNQTSWQMFVSFVPYQTPTSISVSPSAVLAGTSPSGTITLSGNAPTGGAALEITSSNTVAVPNISNVTVAAGKTTASFPITTNAVTTPTTVTLTATYAGQSTTGTLTVNPLTVSSLTASPNPITGGISTTGTIKLAGPAPTNGEVVSFTSSNTSAIPTISIVTVPAGETSSTFAIATKSVTSTQTSKITATLNGKAVSDTVTVVEDAVTTFAATPTPVTGGYNLTGTIKLAVAAPAGGVMVTLSSNNTAAIPIQASESIAAGQMQVSFTIPTKSVASQSVVTLTAKLNGVPAYAIVTVVPTEVLSVSVSPDLITGSVDPTGTVTLTAPAPAGGAIVTLNSSYRNAVPLVSSVTVPAGKSSATFPVATNTVTANQNVTITATLIDSAKTTLAVVPAVVTEITLSSSSVKGGTSLTGAVYLTAAAPSGGLIVTLKSSNSTAVPITASVTVPIGKLSQTFTITTKAVTANTSVLLTATLNGTATANLTVTH